MMKKNKKTQLSKMVVISIFAAILFGSLMVFHSCQSKTSAETNEDIFDDQMVAEEPQPEVKPVFVVDETEPIFNMVEEQPEFPGGEIARLQFLRDNITYPDEAKKKGIQGTVFVAFVVEKDGTITNPSILRGIGWGCDDEVIRITKLMPKWNPGLQRGEPVRTQFRMPVTFKLASFDQDKADSKSQDIDSGLDPFTVVAYPAS